MWLYRSKALLLQRGEDEVISLPRIECHRVRYCEALRDTTVQCKIYRAGFGTDVRRRRNYGDPPTLTPTPTPTTNASCQASNQR